MGRDYSWLDVFAALRSTFATDDFYGLTCFCMEWMSDLMRGMIEEGLVTDGRPSVFYWMMYRNIE